MPENKTDSDIVIVEVERGTRNQIKVLASLEGETTPQYLKWLINKAYEAKIINHRASKKVKEAITS